MGLVSCPRGPGPQVATMKKAAGKRVLSRHHVERLSSDPEVMKFARGINASFKKTGLTELEELDSECEAVYLQDVATGRIASIIVFVRVDKASYYIPIIWTSPRHRKVGCYLRLLEWLKTYARTKGATRIDTDVHYDNHTMTRLMDKNWGKTFVRYVLPLGRG